MQPVLGKSSGCIIGGRLKLNSDCCHGLSGKAPCLSFPRKGLQTPEKELPAL